MTYATTPDPPPPNKGGRPEAHRALADALLAAPPGEWVIVPPSPGITHQALLVTLRRKPYFTDRKVKSRTSKDGTLYLRLGGPK